MRWGAVQFLLPQRNTAYDSHMTYGLCWGSYLSLPRPHRALEPLQESESIES
jgi:hypothetical protein